MSHPLPNLRIPSDAELAEALALAGTDPRAAEGNARRAADRLNQARREDWERRSLATRIAVYGSPFAHRRTIKGADQ